MKHGYGLKTHEPSRRAGAGAAELPWAESQTHVRLRGSEAKNSFYVSFKIKRKGVSRDT